MQKVTCIGTICGCEFQKPSNPPRFRPTVRGVDFPSNQHPDPTPPRTLRTKHFVFIGLSHIGARSPARNCPESIARGSTQQNRRTSLRRWPLGNRSWCWARLLGVPLPPPRGARGTRRPATRSSARNLHPPVLAKTMVVEGRLCYLPLPLPCPRILPRRLAALHDLALPQLGILAKTTYRDFLEGYGERRMLFYETRTMDFHAT